jgi:hypothetical protein
MGELMRRLQQAGVERIVVEKGAEATEITRLIQVLAAADPNQVAGLGTLRHIRVGRLQVEERVEAPGRRHGHVQAPLRRCCDRG